MLCVCFPVDYVLGIEYSILSSVDATAHKNFRKCLQLQRPEDGISCEPGESAGRPQFRANDHMPARKSPATRAPAPASKALRPAAKRTEGRGKRAATRRWRREVRPRILRWAATATESLRWSPALVELLFEELYVYEGLEDLFGARVRELKKSQYPQAIASALILRHSWRADDLACILERLGLHLRR